MAQETLRTLSSARSPDNPDNAAALKGLIIAAMVVVALYVGRDVFVPIALALLFAVALVPVTNLLRRWGLPRAPSVLLVVVVALGLVAGVLVIVAAQVIQLAADLPTYEATLRAKLRAVSEGSGAFDGALRTLRGLSEELTGPNGAEASGGVAVTSTAAVAPQRPVVALFEFARLAAGPIASLAVSVLLLIFLLLQREDVRDRFLMLVGTHDLHRSTRAMADATDRVGKYLLMQLLVNATFGAGMGAGLYLIGLANAPLWGLLAFVLRFVPFVGAWLSLLFPLVLAVATTTGWSVPLQVVLLFLCVDVLCAYVLEPRLYGSSTGISPLALLVSAAIWTALWGPVGLVLAPPITACLIILGRHVPALGFLAVLFGNAETLPPQVRFYQRFLADDAAGAEEVGDAYVLEHGFPALLRDVVMPALETFRQDRRAGLIRGPALVRIAEGVTSLVETLEDRPVFESTELPIAVIGVAGPLDRAAAAVTAAWLRHTAVNAVAFEQLPSEPTAACVLCMMDLPSLARIRRAVIQMKRLGATPIGAVLGEVEASRVRAIGELGTSIVRSLKDVASAIGALPNSGGAVATAAVAAARADEYLPPAAAALS